MPEIRDRVEYCRFTNCRHLNEPGCAVKTAVDKGEIDPERYAFYKELAEKAIAAEKNTFWKNHLHDLSPVEAGYFFLENLFRTLIRIMIVYTCG